MKKAIISVALLVSQPWSLCAADASANALAAHQVRISAHDARISAHDAHIAALQARIDKLETSLANLSAALDAQNRDLQRKLDTKLTTTAGGDNCFGTSNGYRLCMQTDGNLVVYDPSNGSPWNLFSNNAQLRDSCIYGGDFRACMQGDGNFVVYRGSKANWSSFGGLAR